MGQLSSVLFEIKNKLLDMDIKLSDNKFSRIMLSKSARYISYLRATNNEPALDCMVSLYARLDDLRERFEKAGNANAEKLNDMCDTLWAAIRRSSLTQVPKRRATAARRNRIDTAQPTA